MKDTQEKPKTSLIRKLMRKIFRKHRPCPNCKTGLIVVEKELESHGSRCMTCLTDFEIDNKWFFIIWGALIVLMLASFELHYLPEAFGLVPAFGLIIIGTYSTKVVAAWFPLKAVDDSDYE